MTSARDSDAIRGNAAPQDEIKEEILRGFGTIACSVLALNFLVWLPIAAQTGTSEDKEFLRHLKQIEWPRAYREQNVDLLDRILAPEFERIGFEGERSSKQDELDRVRASKPSYDTLAFAITRLEIFPNGSAIVSGIGTVKGRDAEGPYTVTYSSSNVLLKRDGRWQAVSSHVSGRRMMRP